MVVLEKVGCDVKIRGAPIRIRNASGCCPSLSYPPLKQGHVQALIPWADFVNHDVACSSHIEWDATAGSVVLVAFRDYQPGEQICEWAWGAELRVRQIQQADPADPADPV